jgi:hypothetical protein
MFSACFSAPPCLRVKKHPPTRCNPDPDGTVGVPLCTEHANLDFPSFQSLPDPKGRNCPRAVLYRKCRSGLLHYPPARSAAPAAPGSCNRVADWPLRVDRWGGPPGPALDLGSPLGTTPRPPAGRPARRPVAGEGARPTSLHRTRYRAPSLRTPCGTIVRVPDGLGVGRRSIHTTASGRIYPGKCQQRAVPNQVARQFERIGSGAPNEFSVDL